MEIVVTDLKMHYPQSIINIIKKVLYYMSIWYVIGLGDILLTFLQRVFILLSMASSHV